MGQRCPGYRFDMQWFYVDGDRRVGPVSEDEIRRLISAGLLGPTDLLWRTGLTNWEPLAQHFADEPAEPSGGMPPAAVPPLPATVTGRRRRLDSYTPPEPRQDRLGRQSHTGPDGLYIHAPARGFTEAISVCLRSYVRFSGRASRSEYWYFVLFGFIMGIVTSILDSVFFNVSMSQDDAGPLNTLLSLALLLPTLAVSWRRLHDINRSGWWIGGFFLGLIAMVLGVVFGVAVLGIGGGGNWAVMVPIGAVMMLAVFAYWVVLLVFTCTRGDPGPNRFG